MINLLPPKVKREIIAGRSNVILWRYCVVSLILGFLLIVATAGIYFIMAHTRTTARQTIETGNRQALQYQKVQQDYESFSANLKIAKAILDKDVRYSKVALKIAQAMPSGTILQTLTLDSKKLGTPMTINARGKTYGDALRLKDSFQQSSLFKDVNLASAVAEKENKDGYPINITINVTMVPEVAKQ